MKDMTQESRLSCYQLGRTSIFASQIDQRFSYCCYIPARYAEKGTERYPLVVLVHGSNRDAETLRNQFADFAEAHQVVVLAPLFPCGIEEPADTHNYKRIEYRGIRFDRILLGMIDEVDRLYRLDSGRFLLHGFSGGGQFVHRFFYLHPERLLAISIAAPGVVTLPTPDRSWWVGTGGIEAQLGRAMNLVAMRQVAVQMVVGAEDLETSEVAVTPDSSHWMDGINESGETRVARLKTLERTFLSLDIPVRFDLVAGAGHEGCRLQPPVKDFFGAILTRLRNDAGRPATSS